MKRILTLLLFVAGLLLPSVAHAQFITVTGILQDPNGAPYVNCTLVVTFNPAPGATQAPTINGQPFPTVIPLANCNAYGYFTVQNVADNLLVQDGHPAGQQSSTWSFRFCSGPGFVPQVCFIYTAVITHSPSTGNTIDISGQLSAIPPPILPPPGGGGGGGGGGTPLTLTTTGVNGAATLSSNTLNVPNYSLFVTTNNTSGPSTFTAGTNGTTLNIPNYNVLNSVTNNGQGGPPTLAGSILNIPQYQAPITVTSTGAGHASFAGSTLNIPANQVILTTNGTTGASTFDPITNILNIPSYSSGSGGGVPSGSYPGQLLIVGAGNTLAAANPGLAEAASSPIAGTGTVTPNCSSTSSIGDLGQNFVLQPGAVVNVPAAACASAVFYFFAQGAATFNAPAGQTLNIYNGANYTTGNTFAASMGQYITLIRSKAANTWLMAIGNATTATSQFISSISTTGSAGPATVTSGVLNVPDYSTAPEPPPGIQVPAGALTGQVLAIDTTGANVIAGSPGLSDSSASPATMPYTPSCGTTDTGDRSRITVVTAAITITVPPTTNVLCKNAVFYFLFQAAAQIVRSGTDTFDVYNGSTALTAQTTYAPAAGAYLTIVNGSGSNWHIMVESGPGTGGGGTPVQWQQQGTLLGTPTIINCTTNVTCSFAGSTVTMSAVGGAGPANGAIKPAATAGVIFLDNVNGNDSNDGLSWGSAKATLVNSYAALPANGGTIYMAKNWGTCLNLPTTGLLLNVLHKTVVIQGDGAYSTCLQYNGTGNAITVDTGESSSMRDLYIQDTVATANGATGLDIGPTNGCNKCSFMHVNVAGFTTGVLLDAKSYGTLMDHDQIGSCSAYPTATTTIALNLGANGGSDDTRISNSELLNCSTLLNIPGAYNGSVFFTKTVFEDASQFWVNQNGGNFNCDQCHWFNPNGGPSGPGALNFFSAEGITATITNSVFEDAQVTGNAPNAGFVATGCTLTFSNNFIYHYGGRTLTQFITVDPGTPPSIPAGKLAPGAMNNTIYGPPLITTALVPKLYNINPINQVIFPVNAGAITSSTIVSTGQGAAFTPQSSTVALISYQLSVTPTTATPAIYIYRTTGNIPAANAAPNAGDTIIVAGGMINAAIDTFRGAYYDAGITPGTLYRYYVAANTGGVATTFSATATYRVQITEKHE